jgi:hypothetical protein
LEAQSYIFNCYKKELLVNSVYKRSFLCWNFFVDVVDYLLYSNLEKL